MQNDVMPSCLDREVTRSDKDAFGHRHLSLALRSLIESKSYSPPFSIGLLGGWGTGKSTIKELYLSDLGNDQTKVSGRTRSERYHALTFNAWRFGGEGIKRALLRQVFLELGGDDEDLRDYLYREIRQTRQRRKTWWQYTVEMIKVWAMPIPVFLISLLILAALLTLTLWLIPIDNDIAQAIIGAALTGAYSYLLKQFKSPPISPFDPVTRIELPSTSAEQYEDLLLNQLSKYKSGNGKHCERLLIFVDDLDRLSADEMVQGLDAIRTFMEIPPKALPEGIGLVFVISCDEDRVAAALARGRRQADLPGTVFTRSDARRYLDRIFQFRLEIPPFPRMDMRQYASEKLKELGGIMADLEERNVPLENVVDRMIHVDVQSPRNALQIVNAFSQAWWLAKKRETDGLGTDRSGGLHEGAVTDHPIALGVLSALKVDYPDFYSDLQSEPELIQRFTDVLVREKPLEDQPPATQHLLRSKYLQDKSDSEVQPEFRPLRRFLANLVGLRWPDSMQPLLLLSEDPISRKYGATAQKIYEAFVSGDTKGVLEGFGRSTDKSLLQVHEARLIHQMTEDLNRESETRRVNAARVLADLVERIPSESSRVLVGPLCRQLADSPDLRFQLGLDKIAQLLTIAEPIDRVAVSSRLVDEVLCLEGDMPFRLATMEPPNLDEAIVIVRQTVDLALTTRSHDGLDAQSDRQLLSWLEGRIISANGSEYQFPFIDFESWMNNHENHLLPDLRERYTALLLAELESDEGSNIDISSAVTRAKKVFSLLWNAGEDSRSILWKQLPRFAALQEQEAVTAACDVMVIHNDAPEPTSVSAFIVALAQRLKKEAEDDDWSLDLKFCAETLKTILQTRIHDLNDEAGQSLAELVDEWSTTEENSAMACNVLTQMLQADMKQAMPVIDAWVPRLLSELPTECVKFLSKLFPNLSDKRQAALIAQLQPIVSTDNIAKRAGGSFRAFLEGIPSTAWKSANLVAYLDQLLPQVAARHNNPHEYLTIVFPVVAKLLSHATPSVVGAMLQNLFTNAKAQTNLYAWLHHRMAQRWPEASDEFAPYNPVQIFADAHQFAIAQSAHSSEGLLLSMWQMLERTLVPQSNRTQLIEAVVSTWIASPGKAIDMFRKGVTDLVPQQIANLLDGINWQEEEQAELIHEAWAAIAATLDSSDAVKSTNSILLKGPCGPDHKPDEGLKIWLDAQAGPAEDLFSELLTQDNLDDSHRSRVWSQIRDRSDDLGSEFFIEVIPQVLSLPSVEQTARTILSDVEALSPIQRSTDTKARLSQRLMENIHNASTKTIKAEIASLCNKLSGQASLKSLQTEQLADIDLEILHSKFPGASVLKKIDKSRKKESEKST